MMDGLMHRWTDGQMDDHHFYSLLLGQMVTKNQKGRYSLSVSQMGTET
jgi:hypothetical protein